MADLEHEVTANLIDMNAAAAAAVGFLNPLGAQLDAMIAANAQFRAELAAQLDAAVALQASLSVGIGLEAAIQAALEALVALQAALSITVSADVSASAAISAALSAKLAALASIEAAIAIKIPALIAAAGILANLNVGPAVLLTFNGLVAGDEVTLGEWGNKIQTAFNDAGGVGVGTPILPGDNAAGIIMVTKGASVAASLGVIITGAPL